MTSSLKSRSKVVTASRRRPARPVEGDLERQRARATFLPAPRPTAPKARVNAGVELLGEALQSLFGAQPPALRG